MASRTITGTTPEREQALHERLMLRLARSAENPIKREINRATRAIAMGVDDAMETHERRMNQILTSLYTTAFDTFGRRMWNATQKSHKPSETKRDVPLTPQFDMARRLWIRAVAAEKVTMIAGTTQEQALEIIRQATEDGIADGLGEIQLAKLIQSRINEQGGQLSRLRSRMIARTESHAASTASNQMAVKASGLPMIKEWVASGGERTRETHIIAHGQKVLIDQPFSVGMDLLMQPGDPSGSAAEVINCRCIATYSLE